MRKFIRKPHLAETHDFGQGTPISGNDALFLLLKNEYLVSNDSFWQIVFKNHQQLITRHFREFAIIMDWDEWGNDLGVSHLVVDYPYFAYQVNPEFIDWVYVTAAHQNMAPLASWDSFLSDDWAYSISFNNKFMIYCPFDQINKLDFDDMRDEFSTFTPVFNLFHGEGYGYGESDA